MGVPTGLPVLDDLLGGGLPERRAVLVAGGPGSGKTTLAMQFLQAGLDAGEECLYVSTEQTADELRDAFAPFDFDTDHGGLTFTTVHATPGYTLDGGEEVELTLGTMDGTPVIGDGYSAPFDGMYIQQFLERFGPCDRVAFDTVSGLTAMTDDPERYRRAVFDLIRLFTDRFRATTLLTAETSTRAGEVPVDPLEFNTHGVLRLWRDRVDGDVHRFLRVEKMRGVAHDDRAYELELHPSGVTLSPRNPDPGRASELDFAATGLAGLDDLTGGGLVRGRTALLEHDGRAAVAPLVAGIAARALRDDEAVGLVPGAGLDPDRFDRLLPDEVGPIDELADRGRLFALDLVGTWADAPPSVLSVATGPLRGLRRRIGWPGGRAFRRAFRRIDAARGTRPLLLVCYADPLATHLDPGERRRLHAWVTRTVLRPRDRLLVVLNPAVEDDRARAFYADDATQRLGTRVHDEGLQYVSLLAAPTGRIGGSRLVAPTDAPPYVEVRPRADGTAERGPGSAPSPAEAAIETPLKPARAPPERTTDGGDGTPLPDEGRPD